MRADDIRSEHHGGRVFVEAWTRNKLQRDALSRETKSGAAGESPKLSEAPTHLGPQRAETPTLNIYRAWNHFSLALHIE